jgi:SAM-dependent methyltransferase
VRSDDERKALAETFDRAATLYQWARPDYPDELFDDLFVVSGIQQGDHLLEVGCATGKATLPLARRGLSITCIEPGRHLAAVARKNLKAYDVRVVETSFETWRPRATETYALVYAATAWKWIDPSVRYRRAWEALRPGGHLALWNAQHVFPTAGDPFFVEIQEVYDAIGEDLPPDAVRPGPGELPEETAEIEESGLFDIVHVRHFDWEVSYDASSYIDLLNTFSNHIAMSDSNRNRLYAEIRKRLAKRPDGTLRRHWGAVLHVARRRD